MSDYLLAGRYRLTDRIAAGGMGEVWRGEDDLLTRSVAVKLLPTGRAGDEAFLARFRAEARYAASLSHPGIARVYDYGESAEFGGAYLVMELVNGEPLSAILARAGRLSPDATLDIVSQAARALDAAHQAGIVHRDIKPGNLLLTPTGHAKLCDLGLAKPILAEAELAADDGATAGTPYYMSPEQIRGEELDARSDIYSMGAVMYRVLTGEAPFQAPSPVGVLTKALTDDLVPPSRRRPDASFPPAVDDIVVKAMARMADVRSKQLETYEKLAAAGKKGRDKQLSAKGEGERRARPRRGPARGPSAPRPQLPEECD